MRSLDVADAARSSPHASDAPARREPPCIRAPSEIDTPPTAVSALRENRRHQIFADRLLQNEPLRASVERADAIAPSPTIFSDGANATVASPHDCIK